MLKSGVADDDDDDDDNLQLLKSRVFRTTNLISSQRIISIELNLIESNL